LHFWNAPMLSELDEDSSSKNWCPRPSRVQNRLKLLREISGAPSSRDVASAQRNRHRLMAAFRSSIRSRSTSQNLSDERRRLCAGSSWLVSSSFEAVLRDALEHSVDFCSLRLDLDVLKRVRLSRPALIDNDSPFS
jgi:hypothetical protein